MSQNSQPAITLEKIEQNIRQGLDKLDISYGERAITMLGEYMVLLQEWNQTHNLTAVDDPQDMLGVHILDSASIKPYLKGASLLDVGSGAGLPGMILAILSPALQVVSVESRNKKAQFQMFAANKLKLKNFSVETTRVEDYQVKDPFSMIVARAYADLTTLVKSSKHLLSSNGRWLAMKGQNPEDETKMLKKQNYKYDTYALKVPQLDAQRHLVVIEAKT